jgi:hypothetical protein
VNGLGGMGETTYDCTEIATDRKSRNFLDLSSQSLSQREKTSLTYRGRETNKKDITDFLVI